MINEVGNECKNPSLKKSAHCHTVNEIPDLRRSLNDVLKVNESLDSQVEPQNST